MGNTLVGIIIGILAIYVGYNFYAKRIDRAVIGSDPKKATPATLYMDGVDFVPTNRNVLYGYHFKSIAAAGPIVGAITAGAIWGWVPSLLWLVFGVMFMGWASDYSAIVVSVRNEGNSLSATAHQLISPRTRNILLAFIFVYLLLVVGAFTNLVANVLVVPTVPLGIIALGVLGLVGGQLLYRVKMDLILVTIITVGGTLLFVLLNASASGPVAMAFKGFNASLDSLAPHGITTVLNPLAAANAQQVPITVSFVFWLVFLFVFCYLGAVLPIWRYAQPVNYIGFWITGLTIVLGGLGALIAFFIRPDVSNFKLAGVIGGNGLLNTLPSGAIQPIWPMLFVTIACGAISGWHALIGSVGTARQIENETDMLPVGGGAMFSEFTLGLLSLLALAVAAPSSAAAQNKFAAGIGGFLNVFGIPATYGTAIGFAAFVVIVITVTQLIFRLMRVTLTEALGDRSPIFRNQHFNIILSMVLALFLNLTGTYVYIYQLFGASNQLMASLSLIVVAIWLASTRRNPAFAGLPAIFMYVTTMAATLVVMYNMYVTIIAKPGTSAAALAGNWFTIALGAVIFLAAAVIGIDGIRAYQKHRGAPARRPRPAVAPA